MIKNFGQNKIQKAQQFHLKTSHSATLRSFEPVKISRLPLIPRKPTSISEKISSRLAILFPER